MTNDTAPNWIFGYELEKLGIDDPAVQQFWSAETGSLSVFGLASTVPITNRNLIMKDGKKSDGGSVAIVALIVIAIALIISSATKDSGSSPSTTSDPPVHRYDPKSTSEENRRIVRDQMIKQDTDPAEAEEFTKQLFWLEKEHRKKHNLPDY